MQLSEAQLPSAAWTIGTVSKRIDWAPGLFTITVEAPVQPFVSGQFLMLGLPLEDKFIKRAYSVASCAGQPPEFYIALVADGALTPSLFNLQPGDQVGITTAAQGHFTLEYVLDAPALWFIATGTGLAPFIAMMRTEEPWRRFGKVVLVHGVRHSVDLAYQEELAAHAAAHPGQLVYIPVVTRDPDAQGVLHGRIPKVLDQIQDLAGVVLAPDTSQVLLCGNPDMIKDLEALFTERGMPRNKKSRPGNVTTERYW